jgi:hypothetical protein
VFDRTKILTLDENTFDQDFNRGWQILDQHQQCSLIIAELIRDYRQARAPLSKMFFWHERQVRGKSGQTEMAIELFVSSQANGSDDWGWNFYVDGTIAFLKKSKKSALKRVGLISCGIVVALCVFSGCARKFLNEKSPFWTGFSCGGPCRARTYDLWFWRPPLYQLS